MKKIDVYTPSQVLNGENPAPISQYNLQFLAQGDSWFSTGAVPPSFTTNLFDGMGTSTIGACAVNCAQPGAHLSLMVDSTRDRQFMAFLNGVQSRRWAGLLLSGGGNDMIAAAQQPPTNTPGLRLFATSSEWTQALGAERYLSNAGWQTFCVHITQVFNELLVARDSGENRGMPVVMHSYDVASPRNVGAGFGFGPWLYPAMIAYNIPQQDWLPVAQVLLDRLQTLLDHIAANTPDGSVHVVHGQGTLMPALPTDTEATADWENEIHPTPQGYRQLSALWQPMLDAVFVASIASTDTGGDPSAEGGLGL